MTTKTELSEDRKTLILTAGDLPHVSKMTTAEVEVTLRNLGIARGAMLPEIPQTWEPHQQQAVPARRDLPRTLEHEALNGDTLLHIRDPNFGWLHFVFSRNVARQIGEALIRDSELPPPLMAGKA
jgi:hypothetical protein